MQTKTTFKQPDSAAQEHSLRLQALIKREIEQAGAITFARFMHLALYTPGLGYYSAQLPKIGRQGDFVTAPTISSLFSACLANQCHAVLTKTRGNILELGAGSGQMAADILLHLESLNSLPNIYYILEVSADLKQRQQHFFAQHIPHLQNRIVWLNDLTNFKFTGIVLANEVIDAFPVNLFKITEAGLQEYFVAYDDNKFHFELQPPTATLRNYFDTLSIDFEPGYQSECNLVLDGWLRLLNDVLEEGVVLLIDYGFPRATYYHPDRNSGTLMCHYQHHAHDDPLINIGLQDLTAHVDFTAVANFGIHAGLTLAGFTTQAHFLIATGLLEMLEHSAPEKYAQLANEVKILTSPNEMGELFKIMAFAKNYDLPLQGFSLRDICEKL